ncbi:MAG: N-acetylmuramoyl-L-alanine amidase [Arenimonas sp.]|uniref:N-acetylmuramoyl-L-alanine amidase n=1 Tax=Arenimonas sp. TaxID=1872635 RepID=UPI003BFFD930
MTGFARLLRVLPLLMLVACVHQAPRNPMAQWSPSPNFDERRPRLIVLHATEMSSADAALRVLKTGNSGGRVSAHYLIAEDGRIFQLVSDSKRAWHAGGGRWRGINDLNSVSLGIELDNDGSEDFAPAQIAALKKLLADLCERHAIPRDAVIAHGDMAPTRKRDPSARFPWQDLWQAGFGVWYAAELPEPPAGFDAILALQAFGYDTRDLPAAVKAFTRRFRGEERDVLDDTDRRILYDLITP